MRRIIKIGLGIWLLVIFTTCQIQAQQLPQYTQYIFNGLHINPGYAGYKNEGYLQSTYRDQWVAFPGAPKTFTFTADLSANDGTMGFGFSMVSDRLGPTETNSFNATYAYRIQTGQRSFLGLGVTGGVSQYTFDPNKLKPESDGDPLLPEGVIRLYSPNFNAGLFFNTDGFYAGFSAYNMIGKKSILREDVALGFHDFHFYLTAGGLISLSDDVQFKPSFLLKHVKGSPINYDINAMFLFMETVWIGASYRSNFQMWNDNLQDDLSRRNAVAALVEIFIAPSLRLGYAYDHSLNALQSFKQYNSHELSVGYYLFKKRNIMKNPRWL
ncbi:PorP/SprF family type IX secretion system membrane protein [Algoriphagus limi]|uniref:Type IX secretion system membrane protein PorP/SprF n=1 Tax=Algoriphagus limi TaxID=2975273 RepID=A0ABT2G8W8_9BACT|nr:type IX secretion system membrane protein PorP/SprF [Algoriphagus limi]MCS5491198.1 type IX secretion system membrane protein PorP/SprF [Algoriphagus limi]